MFLHKLVLNPHAKICLVSRLLHLLSCGILVSPNLFVNHFFGRGVFALASLPCLCYNSVAMRDVKSAAAVKAVAMNKKARYDYHLQDRYEAGIVLQGTEVKAIRTGRLNLTDSYARVENGEVFLIDAHIGPYEQGNLENHEPKRKRKLLLNRREIRKMEAVTRTDSMTVVPTKAYFSNGKVKVELALARGKRDYDKREDLKKEADQRAIQSYLR